MSTLTTGQAARLVGKSAYTLRAWERRYGADWVMEDHVKGQHRRFNRAAILSIRRAVITEGLDGQAALERGKALFDAGFESDPQPLVDRMGNLEQAIRRLTNRIEMLSADIQKIGAA